MVMNNQSEISFDAAVPLGVAITQVNAQQRHIGIIYCIDGTPRLCHLASHHDLRDEPLPKKYLWGEIGIDEFSQSTVAAYVSEVSQNREIAYGLHSEGPCFDDAGRYVPQTHGKGLTCATFVLEIFDVLGFSLLNRDEWPKRPGDKDWQENIIKIITPSASPEHIETMRRDVGKVKRFCPEEVAAACLSTDHPVPFSEAEKLAEQILADVRSAFPS